MTDPNPADRSNSDSAHQIDPQRLTALLAEAVSLHSAGEDSCVDLVLKQIDDVDREAYRQALLDQLGHAISDPAESRSVDRLLDETVAETSSAESPAVSRSAGRTGADMRTAADRSLTARQSPRDPDDHARSAGQQDALPTLATDSGHPKPESPLPEKIGKFRVTQELGRGGFGVVYLCMDDELQRKVALKVTHVADPVRQERLRIEASKVAQIESLGIVPVYHIGKTDDGNVYIVQKYIQGSTLRDLLKQSPLSPLMATEILRDMALGLEPAHAQEILHRDLKPDNVLIDESGQAWIADFGLAISEEEQEGCPREFAGTPPYMAPEQINGRIDFMDPRSDIWALGVMYYEMLSGKRPFRGKDRRALKEQICELDPRPLQQRDPGRLTEAMNNIFLRCCAKKPSDRYATVRELADDLDDLIASGLSDQNVVGKSMNVGTADSFAHQGRSRTRRNSRRLTSRRSTMEAVEREPSNFDTYRSEDTVLHPGRWLPTWIQGLAAALAVVVLSVVGGVGYQMYLHSTSPPEEDAVTAAEPASAEALLAAEAVVPGPARKVEDGNSSDMSAGEAATAVAVRRDENSNAMGPDQADGSAAKPWVVATDGSGSHRSISAAIAAGASDPAGHPVSATTRIHIKVKPGDYDEVIRITTPVTIEGMPEKVTYADGQDRYPCQIQSDQDTPLLIDMATSREMVELKYFAINGRRRDAEREFNAVDLTGGTLVLRNCDLSTMSFNCIKARKGSRLAAFECNFHDSFQFAISTSDHNQLVAENSDFYGDGIQLTGGTAKITDCRFYGSEGIYVSRSTSPVSVAKCSFTGNLDYGIASTNRGNVICRENSFLDCKKGVWVMVGDDIDNRPDDDLPAKLELVDSSLTGCETAMLVEGGTLIARKDCKIERGRIGLSVTTGSVTLTDTVISELAEHGISVSDAAEIALENCTIELTEAAAILLSKGNLTVTGGRIVDYASAGIIVGLESDWPQALATCKLHDVKISESSAPGIIAFSGPVTIEKVTLEGGAFGLMAVGPDVANLSSPPLVDISLDTGSAFLNQKEAGIFAKGDSRITLNRKSWRALSDEIGGKAKVVAPASIEFE